MKTATSWSRQEASRQKCPKRFHLTYLETSGVADRYRNLKSVREVGGLVIHEALSRVVKSVADGGRLSDHGAAASLALQRFDSIVNASRRLPPWQLDGSLQVAEFHNGVSAEGEVDHWRELVPLCVENGLRVLATLNVRADAGDRSVLPEQVIRFHRNGREHRGVIDLLLVDGKNCLVVEWKCHAITETDIAQVKFYQDYLIKAGRTTLSRAHGLVVDLIREEIVQADYRPFDQLLSPRRRPPIGALLPSATRNPYPARPSAENCGRCPFAAICEQSVIRPMAGSGSPLMGELA